MPEDPLEEYGDLLRSEIRPLREDLERILGQLERLHSLVQPMWRRMEKLSEELDKLSKLQSIVARVASLESLVSDLRRRILNLPAPPTPSPEGEKEGEQAIEEVRRAGEEETLPPPATEILEKALRSTSKRQEVIPPKAVRSRLRATDPTAALEALNSLIDELGRAQEMMAEELTGRLEQVRDTIVESLSSRASAAKVFRRLIERARESPTPVPSAILTNIILELEALRDQLGRR